MLFVSYASQDRPMVDPLVAVLRNAGQHVWLDEELGGGEAWWQAILERIRGCEVFVVALSNTSLRSKPCQAELAYARALHRPVLPVQIGPVDSLRVTPLAATQVIDYRTRGGAAEARLIAALRSLSGRDLPLPVPLPDEPMVPFAYLMRLSSDLSGPDLNARKQAELVLELRTRLDEDCDDDTVRSDIVQLLCRLRDRPDVTVRTRADVDAVLAANDPNFNVSTVGMRVAAVTGPNRVAPQSIPARPAATEQDRSSARGRLLGGWSKKKLLAAGAVLAVAGGIAVAAGIITRSPLEPPAPALVDDTDVNAVMGASAMTTAQADMANFKPSSAIDSSLPDCLGVLYPGMDRAYQGSQAQRAAWKVVEEPGGLQRAGIDGRHFVDQAIATFAPKTDQAAAFVERSLPQWRACAGKTVTVSYPDHSTYSWQIGDMAGDAPRITQTYTRTSGGYTCQRVLDAVSNVVIDVKACGEQITNQAGVLTDMIAAVVSKAPAF